MVDTRYQLQPGESIAAYNARVQQYYSQPAAQTPTTPSPQPTTVPSGSVPTFEFLQQNPGALGMYQGRAVKSTGSQYYLPYSGEGTAEHYFSKKEGLPSGAILFDPQYTMQPGESEAAYLQRVQGLLAKQSQPTQQTQQQPTQQSQQQQQSSNISQQDYYLKPGETIDQYNARIAALRSGSTTKTSPQQTGAQANQAATSGALVYDPSKNPSVVDLLNSVGQDSSFAARQQLAQQFGIQGYTGSATQNQELAKKFTDMYNAKKGSQPPANQAEFMQQAASFAEGQKQPFSLSQTQDDFLGQYLSMNPVEKSLFDGLSQLLSPQAERQSLTEIFAEEMAKAGVPALQEQLADITKIIDGTEDDIRAEITASGGLATESQVKALVGARNKTLIREANYLTDLINTKNDYVEKIVQLTSADREELDRELDRKLGITQMLFTITDRMQTRARENYQSIINDIGYDGLVDSISSQQELESVASSLGMSPKTLLGLSTVKTSNQRKQEMEMLNYQLSVDKFNEDKRQFGLQYALEAQKVANANAATATLSPYQQRNSQLALKEIDSLLPRVSSKTVGSIPASVARHVPGTEARDFSADVDELLSSIFKNELNAMREASKTGGAVGNVSDKEGSRLANSIGALEDLGQSPENYKKNLLEAKDSIYSWNGQLLAMQLGFDYNRAINSTNPATGKKFTSEEIYNYLMSSQ